MRCSRCKAALPDPATTESGDACPICGAPVSAVAENEAIDPPSEPTIEEIQLAAAVDEFESLVAMGERPDLEEFCSKHPAIRETLRQVLTLGRQLAGLDAAHGAAVEIPERLGPYQILERLGQGGMAPVFRALDTRLDREVALKVLPRAVGADSTSVQGLSARERFLREARALARIAHPQVVSIFDVGEADGFCYLAMELLERSMQQVQKEMAESLPGTEPFRKHVAALPRQIHDAALGLQHAHGRGVLHRDVKPANLLVDAGGRVRVADFGLAAMDGHLGLTGPGQAMGTPGFAAPEQLRGEPLDVRCDIYGLGATMLALLGSLRSRAPSSDPDKLDADLSGSLTTLMEVATRATDPDRERRHPDMSSFIRDLSDRKGSSPKPPAGWRMSQLLAMAGAVAFVVILGLALAGSFRRPSASPSALATPGPGIRLAVSSDVVPLAGEVPIAATPRSPSAADANDDAAGSPDGATPAPTRPPARR